MCAKAPLWIEHNRAMRLAPKHHPMPTSSTTLHAPFDRKKGEIRQCLPGVKRLFLIRGTSYDQAGTLRHILDAAEISPNRFKELI